MLASLNVLLLRKHMHELGITLHDYTIDILTLNETRLKISISDDEVPVSGYKIYRSDRN